MPAQRWDVFCKVVDNYGDAGVCWRLARQLAAEHPFDVTLWIDAPERLVHIAPGVDPKRADQTSGRVRIRAWPSLFDDFSLPDVVVEAFGCGLPAAYIDAMATSTRPPLWFNLEYLSAESWIEAAHGLPSPQPRLPLTRHFWFPGFTAATGGLLREAGLIERRDAFRRDPAGTGQVATLLGIERPRQALVISLFCYPNAALSSLLDTWADGDEDVLLIVPEGVGTAAFDSWLAGAVPHAGQEVRRGRLTVEDVPFVSQDDYDRVLWSCDVNFVRGEDSFVRAQWAARPFIWHIYPQADDAHRAKLEAFLARYAAGLNIETAMAATDFWCAWNEGDGARAAAAWPAFRGSFPALGRHGEAWMRRLAARSRLGTGQESFGNAIIMGSSNT